ncbi:MAG: radical SAM protein, partial [Mycobacterium sp.]
MTTDCQSCACADRSSETGPVALTLAPPPPGGAPWYHVVDGTRPQALLVESSALFEISPPLASALTAGDPQAQALLADYRRGPTARDLPADLPAPTAISLNVAQSCNLSCSYCYADEGRFGGSARRMTRDTARAAIDELLDGARAGESVLVGFIGGEPLLNRGVVHDSVAYTQDRASARGVHARFSITTNATLLTASDCDLLRSNPFAVTVSIDGGRARHDRHRRRRGGGGSWD